MGLAVTLDAKSFATFEGYTQGRLECRNGKLFAESGQRTTELSSVVAAVGQIFEGELQGASLSEKAHFLLHLPRLSEEVTSYNDEIDNIVWITAVHIILCVLTLGIFSFRASMKIENFAIQLDKLVGVGSKEEAQKELRNVLTIYDLYKLQPSARDEILGELSWTEPYKKRQAELDLLMKDTALRHVIPMRDQSLAVLDKSYIGHDLIGASYLCHTDREALQQQVAKEWSVEKICDFFGGIEGWWLWKLMFDENSRENFALFPVAKLNQLIQNPQASEFVQDVGREERPVFFSILSKEQWKGLESDSLSIFAQVRDRGDFQHLTITEEEYIQLVEESLAKQPYRVGSVYSLDSDQSSLLMDLVDPNTWSKYRVRIQALGKVGYQACLTEAFLAAFPSLACPDIRPSKTTAEVIAQFRAVLEPDVSALSPKELKKFVSVHFFSKAMPDLILRALAERGEVFVPSPNPETVFKWFVMEAGFNASVDPEQEVESLEGKFYAALSVDQKKWYQQIRLLSSKPNFDTFRGEEGLQWWKELFSGEGARQTFAVFDREKIEELIALSKGENPILFAQSLDFFSLFSEKHWKRIGPGAMDAFARLKAPVDFTRLALTEKKIFECLAGARFTEYVVSADNDDEEASWQRIRTYLDGPAAKAFLEGIVHLETLGWCLDKARAEKNIPIQKMLVSELIKHEMWLQRLAVSRPIFQALTEEEWSLVLPDLGLKEVLGVSESIETFAGKDAYKQRLSTVISESFPSISFQGIEQISTAGELILYLTATFRAEFAKLTCSELRVFISNPFFFSKMPELVARVFTERLDVLSEGGDLKATFLKFLLMTKAFDLEMVKDKSSPEGKFYAELGEEKQGWWKEAQLQAKAAEKIERERVRQLLQMLAERDKK